MRFKVKINSTGEIKYLLPVCNDKRRVEGYKNPDNGDYFEMKDVTIIPQTPYELFGIECGEGWMKLINTLMAYINEYNAHVPESNQIQISQIKEKFGGLRFYVDNSTETLNKMIAKAEDDSYNTCETCGSTKNVGLKSGGWLETICLDCLKKRLEGKDDIVKWRSNQDGKLHEVNKDGIVIPEN